MTNLSLLTQPSLFSYTWNLIMSANLCFQTDLNSRFPFFSHNHHLDPDHKTWIISVVSKFYVLVPAFPLHSLFSTHQSLALGSTTCDTSPNPSHNAQYLAHILYPATFQPYPFIPLIFLFPVLLCIFSSTSNQFSLLKMPSPSSPAIPNAVYPSMFNSNY